MGMDSITNITEKLEDANKKSDAVEKKIKVELKENIADMYMMNDAPRFCVNHIHGTINNPESIIFGYGDELDENFQELIASL